MVVISIFRKKRLSVPVNTALPHKLSLSRMMKRKTNCTKEPIVFVSLMNLIKLATSNGYNDLFREKGKRI